MMYIYAHEIGNLKVIVSVSLSNLGLRDKAKLFKWLPQEKWKGSNLLFASF